MAGYVTYLEKTSTLITMYSTQNSLYFDMLDTSNPSFKKGCTFGKWKETTERLGYSDFAYNATRDIFAYVSATGRVGYHLFDCWDPKIIRKSKWQHLQKGTLTSRSFNAEGTKMVTVDTNGCCLVTDVDYDLYLFHLSLQGPKSWDYRCRWSPVSDDPVSAVTIGYKFNLLDAARKTFILKNPIAIDQLVTTCIEWHKDGNIVACCGNYDKVKIYDRRVGSVVKMLRNIHLNKINEVCWSSDGKRLATASADKSVKVIELESEKVPCVAKSITGDTPTSVCFV